MKSFYSTCKFVIQMITKTCVKSILNEIEKHSSLEIDQKGSPLSNH